jgi:hypothetical protein
MTNIYHKFNASLHILPNISEASFPFQNKRVGRIKNNWITLRMKVYCKHKRHLYSRNSNNPHMRTYYNKYCKILSTVIKEAKRQYHHRLIAKSDNQIKTTCNIIKHLMEQIPSLLIKEKIVRDPEVL